MVRFSSTKCKAIALIHWLFSLILMLSYFRNIFYSRLMTMIFLFLCHRNATEALCIGRIQACLGVVFVSELSGRVSHLTCLIYCWLDSIKHYLLQSILFYPRTQQWAWFKWTINLVIMAVVKTTLRTTSPLCRLFEPGYQT